MTKIYDGAGIYTVSFGCSGKTIELSEQEMEEIAQESPAYQEMEEDYRRDKTELDNILGDIEEQGEQTVRLKKTQDTLECLFWLGQPFQHCMEQDQIKLPLKLGGKILHRHVKKSGVGLGQILLKPGLRTRQHLLGDIAHHQFMTILGQSQSQLSQPRTGI